MKQVLSMTLAAAMLSTAAYAVTIDWRKSPGSSIKLGASYFTTASGEYIPGEVDFTEEYFSVSSKKISKGASLVKSINFVDDDDYGYVLKISLTQDYNNDLTRYAEIDNYYNLLFSDLAVKAKKTVKDDDASILKKGTEYLYTSPNGNPQGKLYAAVGYYYENFEMNDDTVNVYVDQADTNYAYKFVEGTDAYATAEVEFGDMAYGECRVYDSDKVIFKYKTDYNSNILKAYPDAELTFFAVEGNGFPTSMYFELYADEDEYIYKIENGKIVKSGLKWDEDVYAFTGKIRGPVSYVISDIPLTTTSSGGSIEVLPDIEITPDVIIPEIIIPGVNNPDTGAADLSGMMAAMAILSAAAAGAVILKKE